MKLSRDSVREAIFGITDGAATTIGAMFGLYASGHRAAVLIATLSAGISATESMAASEYLSDDDASLPRALAMAGGTAIGGLLPAVPFIFSHGVLALTIAAALVALLGVWVAEERARVKPVAVAYGQVFVTFMIVAVSTYVLGVAL